MLQGCRQKNKWKQLSSSSLHKIKLKKKKKLPKDRISYNILLRFRKFLIIDDVSK